MTNALLRIFALLAPHEKRRAVFLLIMILVMAILDVTGVVSIMPFMAVLANPEMVNNNAVLSGFYAALNFRSQKDFLFFLGVVVFLVLVISLAFRALNTYFSLRFALMCEYSMSQRLVSGYLGQPYVWFLNRNSADLGETVLSEVSVVVNGAMIPILTLLAQGAVALALLVLLLIADVRLAFVVGGVLGVAYGGIYLKVSRYLSRIGEEQKEASKKRFLVLSEAFGAVKDVKLGGLEEVYLRRFSLPAEVFARHQAAVSLISQTPRYVVEAVAFGGMVLMVIYLLSGGNEFAAVLPVIALYAFAGYRLMPALQQIYSSYTAVRHARAALDALYSDIVNLSSVSQCDSSPVPLGLRQEIVLSEICYTYPGARGPALQGLSLTIPARTTVGLVGTTGSGKTTAVDIILGLLDPVAGCVEVDGVPIDFKSRRNWQRTIGYVPQQIYLADDTVAANIAFGLEPREIDEAAVERAARIASLHEFVVKELAHGYRTTVGERGVRLSGGQRQRIGIARALYHNPQVLILDEATSALDNLTEQAVMEAVNKLRHDITIILIAHRLTTVRECDQIYLLDRGRVAAHGTFNELFQNNETFRAMASSNA